VHLGIDDPRFPNSTRAAIVERIMACLNGEESVIPREVANPRFSPLWVREWLYAHGYSDQDVLIEQRPEDVLLRRPPGRNVGA